MVKKTAGQKTVSFRPLVRNNYLSTPAVASSSSLSSTAFERFSTQFDKQFGKSSSNNDSGCSSSSAAAVADSAIIVKMLTRDPLTGQPDEVQQQAFARSLKARDLHKESTKQYNQEQNQFCREVNVHPDTYRLHELDDDDNSSGIIYYYICSNIILLCQLIKIKIIKN